MKILALETSSLAGSVALLEDDVLLQEYDLPDGQRTAQSFAPAIKQQLDKAEWFPSDIDLIAVTQGPGSFTGLRVGVTAAKTLAYVVGAQVIGVNTLQVIAAQPPADANTDFICAAINAQRGELFVGRFRRQANGMPELLENPRIVSNESWLLSLDAKTLVIGPGLGRLSSRIPSEVKVADVSLWNPRASTVGLIGYRQFQNGTRHDLWQLAPEYYRKSAAEEKFESARN